MTANIIQISTTAGVKTATVVKTIELYNFQYDTEIIDTDGAAIETKKITAISDKPVVVGDLIEIEGLRYRAIRSVMSHHDVTRFVAEQL